MFQENIDSPDSTLERPLAADTDDTHHHGNHNHGSHGIHHPGNHHPGNHGNHGNKEPMLAVSPVHSDDSTTHITLQVSCCLNKTLYPLFTGSYEKHLQAY